jgi:hypothetical protein
MAFLLGRQFSDSKAASGVRDGFALSPIRAMNGYHGIVRVSNRWHGTIRPRKHRLCAARQKLSFSHVGGDCGARSRQHIR